MSSAYMTPGPRAADDADNDTLTRSPMEQGISPEGPRQNFDDLEIALRKLPGVRSVGFVNGSDLTMIQLHIDDSKSANSVPMQAARLAYRYAPGSVAVEVIRWRELGSRTATSSDAEVVMRPRRAQGGDAEEMRWIEPRVTIDGVSLSDDGLDVEVVLSFGAETVVRKATIAEGLVGVAAATISGLREFIGELDYEPAWAHVVRPHPDAERMVAIGLEDSVLGEVRTGIAKGDTPPEAAVRATLQALNRTIAARLPVLVND